MRYNLAAPLKRPGGESQKEFLQGLKPIILSAFTPGLKPRPPVEKDFPRRVSRSLGSSQKPCAAGKQL